MPRLQPISFKNLDTFGRTVLYGDDESDKAYEDIECYICYYKCDNLCVMELDTFEYEIIIHITLDTTFEYDITDLSDKEACEENGKEYYSRMGKANTMKGLIDNNILEQYCDSRIASLQRYVKSRAKVTVNA